MKNSTLEAVTKHGETLLAFFKNAQEKNPVALCKKLRRIEVTAAIFLETYESAHGAVSQDTLDSQMNNCLIRACNLLGADSREAQLLGVHINRDFRGPQLKIDSRIVDGWNQNRYADRLPALITDMGGYGILAPDLTA